jgi:hypothetical protein
MNMPKMKWDEVVSEGTLPTMRANCVYMSWQARETSNGRLMYMVGWMLDDPEAYRGMFVNDLFVVGGLEGSGHESEPDTKARDSRRLRSLFEALQVPLNEDLEVCFRAAEGGKATLYIAEPSQKDIDAGYDRNRVKNYFKLGSVDVGVVDGKATPAKAPMAPPPPPPGGGLPRPPQQPPVAG